MLSPTTMEPLKTDNIKPAVDLGQVFSEKELVLTLEIEKKPLKIDLDEKPVNITDLTHLTKYNKKETFKHDTSHSNFTDVDVVSNHKRISISNSGCVSNHRQPRF